MLNRILRLLNVCLVVLVLSGDCFADTTSDQKDIFFGVMAPLYVQPDQYKLFEKLLTEARQIGVEAVSVDVWWGLVFKDRHKPDWHYYDHIFSLIADRGLKIVPILSTHKCGGGPGDNCLCAEPPPAGEEAKCSIPIPPWLYDEVAQEGGYSAAEMFYESETGKLQDDALPPWLTEPEQSPVLHEIALFYQEFKDHFEEYAKRKIFAEINVSLGPTGELRYPAYNRGDGWNYPERGFFQAYGRVAEESFRNSMLKKYTDLAGVNLAWGTQLTSDSQIRPPGGHIQDRTRARADFFVWQKKYTTTRYGIDFVDWYTSSLVEHGRRVLETADAVFSDPYGNIALGMKIPGIHWQLQCTETPRIAEITAGLVSVDYNMASWGAAQVHAHGYDTIFQMIEEVKNTIQSDSRQRDIILHFTALEMDNDMDCTMVEPHGTSRAESLVYWISDGASAREITLRGENALQWVGGPDNPLEDDRNWGKITNAIQYGSYSGFTFLRLWNERAWEFDRGGYEKFIQDVSR